ncbi:hypothetical protein Tco_0983072 [Tanacetum coccineum]
MILKTKERLQAELVEEERLAKQREEDTNIAEWDDVQAMMDVDYELAARLQAQEQGELTIEERSKMFVDLMDKRKKQFRRLRAEEQRRKPPTKAQKRNQMCTYLKNMAGFTHNQLKNKSFDEVQKAFDKTMILIDSFVPMDSEVVKGSKDKAKGSKKRTRKGLDEESVKRQKLEDDAEKAELKLCLEIVPNDDEVVNFEPLATKSPIVDWKTQILGEEMIYYQIKRADRSCKMYKFFCIMLNDFDRQDLIDLYRLVTERFKITRPEGSDRLLWGDLMTIFEPSALTSRAHRSRNTTSRTLASIAIEVSVSLSCLLSQSISHASGYQCPDSSISHWGGGIGSGSGRGGSSFGSFS